MRKKKILISAMLIGSILLSGCKNQTQTAPADNATLGGNSFNPTTVFQNKLSQTDGASAEPIQREYAYVRAELKDNQLQLTILDNKSAEEMLNSWSKVRYNVPYTVSGLTGTYTDMFIGTMGLDRWPYVFLLTEEGNVECVPVADTIYEADNNAYSDAEACFESLGVLPDISDVVSFGQSEDPLAVFAECRDGASYNLFFPTLFVSEPRNAPANSEDSLRMLTENAEIAQLMAQGMELWRTGDCTDIAGEYGRIFSLGGDREEQLSKKTLYAVGLSGAIYTYYVAEDDWHPFNAMAVLRLDGDSYDDLFVILTDPNDPIYQEYKDNAEIINTPVVGLEKTEPVLLVPLKQDLRLKVEMMADDSGDYYTKAVDTFFDETVTGETNYLIGVTLSKTNSVLRVTGSWFDGFDDLEGTWYATYYMGEPLYRQYISGAYSYPPNG